MKKQYLIIGLAGLMACNAVSTSYCNNDDIHLFDQVLLTGQGNDEMDEENGTEIGVAKAGGIYSLKADGIYYLNKGKWTLLPKNKDEKNKEEGSWTRFLPSQKTVIYGAVGLAIAGGLYYLNHTGKLPKNMDSDAVKAFASKMGSAIRSKFSNFKSGVSDWVKSRMPVNNTIKPVNSTLDTTKFCGLNKPQEIVYPKFNSEPVIKTASPVQPKKTLASAFANWFKASKPATPEPKIFGRFIPNNVNPVSFEVKGNPAKPSLGDLFRAKADKVISEAKGNFGSLWAKGGKVLAKAKKNIGLLINNAKSKGANETDGEFFARANNFLKKAK